jgi:hypothetical protein
VNAQHAVELHRVAVQAESASVVLARAVGYATGAGVEVDDRVTEAVATVTAWAAEVAREAEAAPTSGRRVGWVHPDTDTAP